MGSWRNWHTRWTKDPIPQGLGVQIPPSPPFAVLAQLAVQGFRKAQVLGPTPRDGSKFISCAAEKSGRLAPLVRGLRPLPIGKTRRGFDSPFTEGQTRR